MVTSCVDGALDVCRVVGEEKRNEMIMEMDQV